MHPGEVTSVIMKFELTPVPFAVPFSTRVQEQAGAGLQVIPQANEFVWHCHILEHEEHDMMRPLVVTGPNPVLIPGAALAVAPTLIDIAGYEGGTANFSVQNYVLPLAVTPSAGAPPATVVGNQVSVVVPAGSAPSGPHTYTIVDSSGRGGGAGTAVATLNIT